MPVAGAGFEEGLAGERRAGQLEDPIASSGYDLAVAVSVLFCVQA